MQQVDACRSQTTTDDTAEPLPREAAEQLFVEHLASVQQLTARVARQHHLTLDEAEEFAGMVYLRLIADDYGVLRKFRRQCSLQTYLTVVIRRICLDFRDAQWGKWRTSAVSRRRGQVAILLERLTMRDGLTFEEACAVLEANPAITAERDTLARVYAEFRVRIRPRFVSDEELGEVAATGGAPDRPLLEIERAELLSRAAATLVDALATLPPRDQLLLQLRFASGLSVASVARLLHLDQKWLYRRYVYLFARLRKWLEAHAVMGPQIAPLLGDPAAAVTDVFEGLKRHAGDEIVFHSDQGRAAKQT
jgi:RNA polymerase sigma factor (sigma-70 family)